MDKFLCWKGYQQAVEETDLELANGDFVTLQQFAFKPTTNNNIKPFAGLRPATLVVMGLINNCCRSLSSN